MSLLKNENTNTTRPDATKWNVTASEFKDIWSINEDRQAGIFSYVILGLIFLFFFGLVLKDLLYKIRTGEFQRTKKTMPSPPLSKRLPIRFTDLFRDKEHKLGSKNQKIELNDRYDSSAVIERLGGSSSSSQTNGDETKDKDNDKGKAVEIAKLPPVQAKGTTSIKESRPVTGIPIDFAVPANVPELTEREATFAPTVVRGMGPNKRKFTSLISDLDFSLGRSRGDSKKASSSSRNSGDLVKSNASGSGSGSGSGASTLLSTPDGNAFLPTFSYSHSGFDGVCDTGVSAGCE
ncbi:hypothetical protein F66182_5399 [Fusarium sp. NRRL 66182]|nr:hypothetical protein F66182_5399 [Fusarium sp. NRRL 66182]